MISATVLFFLMVLMHIIDDFVLQPKSLGHLKQKNWWKYECEANKVPFKNYRYDYIAALLIHGISWSIMVHLPLMLLYKSNYISYLSISILLMALIHSLIDHLKANKMIINLCADQYIHLIQIIIIWSFFK